MSPDKAFGGGWRRSFAVLRKAVPPTLRRQSCKILSFNRTKKKEKERKNYAFPGGWGWEQEDGSNYQKKETNHRRLQI